MAESSTSVRLLQHHLRQCGMLLATGQLDSAAAHVDAALAIDPASLAALTLRERLTSLRASNGQPAADTGLWANAPNVMRTDGPPVSGARFVPSGVDAASWTDFEQRVQQRRFRALIEAGDRAVAAGDLAGARASLEEARELQPDSLDVSRLSTGRIDLQAEPMNVAEVVREVIGGFDAELAVARCKLTLSAQGTPTGSWDRLRVEQVFRNLLSNAIRFGAGRPIEVAVDADQDFASVTFRDHGIGIPADQQAKIFERFERGPEQRSGGFGIGLWIVRNICAAMGGSVSVDSTVGEGACFTVMLPRRPERQAVRSESE